MGPAGGIARNDPSARQMQRRRCVSRFSLRSNRWPGLLLPEEIGVNLPRSQKVLEGFEPREGAELKDFLGHVDFLEQVAELLSATPCVPGASKTGQVLPYFAKGNTIAAIVGAGGAEGYFAARKHL